MYIYKHAEKFKNEKRVYTKNNFFSHPRLTRFPLQDLLQQQPLLPVSCAFFQEVYAFTEVYLCVNIPF